MQITWLPVGEAELKLRETTVRFGTNFTIGTYQVPGPGEYEAAGVMAQVGSTLIALQAEDLAFGYVLPGAKELTEKELEQLGSIDVLITVLMGENGQTVKDTLTLIGQLEAPLIIALTSEEAAREAFCKSASSCEVVVGPWKLTRSQLPTEGTRVVVLS